MIRAGKKHKEHDHVHVVVNKVGPFNNPTEMYRFYSLPFCQEHATEDEEKSHPHYGDNTDDETGEEPGWGEHPITREKKGGKLHSQRLGQSMVGDRRESTPYELTFGDDVEWRLLCSTRLSADDLQVFRDAIHNTYFFEMFLEDLPMWGYIGEVVNEDIVMGQVREDGTVYLFPHLHFDIGYDGDNRIVSVQVSTQAERRVDISLVENGKKELTVPFSYSVTWTKEPELTWKRRHSRYVSNEFVPKGFEIHWLSIINSFVLVMLLTAFLTIILMRVLKQDFSRYMEIEGGDAGDGVPVDESGWKLIHGDVFRLPPNLELFCASMATGTQLMLTTFILLILCLTGVVSTTKRGSIMSAMTVLYYIFSCVGGYHAMYNYKRFQGKNWVKTVILTATMFPSVVFVVFAYVNTVALGHGSTAALPFGTIFIIMALYAFLSLPLTIVGGIVARNTVTADAWNPPTRTTKIPREIPTDVPWYRTRAFQVCVAGFLPFSAIYIELHYIFASVWGHQIYTLFGILFLAFILLTIVVSFVVVALCYFQLAREDHRWWWSSFINGGMTGILIYMYSFVYFFHKSEMNGILQSSYYFGYMAVISFAFILMFGSAGWHSSLFFVNYIYARIKLD